MTSTGTAEGPYLLAAFICERVLIEQDGVKSAIRIIDRLTRTVAEPNPPDEMQPFDYNCFLFVRLKSGSSIRGVRALRLRVVKPSGESRAAPSTSVLFEGEEDRGVDIVGPMRIRFDQTGIYWFELFFEDRLLTRIPFRVVYMPQPTESAGPGGGGPQLGPGLPPAA